jgi:DNA-binding NtrC family response regulator
LTKDAKEKLMGYYYPGNVRELKAAVDLAAVMCTNNEITADDITFTSVKKGGDLYREKKTLRQYTCDIIQHFLKGNNGDVLQTAKELDIGKSTIYKMIQNGEVKEK